MKIFVPQFIRSSNLGEDAVLWVLSVDGNHAEQRKVSFGTEVRESFIEITDGLRAGDKIILNPPPQIKEGDRVKVIKNQ
jgi:multidrug efflux pump subunit AcrA (membrane-fusion protein)